jgi:asparagine synthase (glutamine-hydrolysing)
VARIAGLIGGTPGDATQALRRMLRAMALPHGAEAFRQTGDAWLGWHGAGEAQIAATQDGVALFDGFAYEGLGGSKPAAAFLALAEAGGFEAAVRAVTGDFAAAYFDLRKRELWLARDRLGVKPLYYAANSGRFAFASRAGALLELPGVRRLADRRFVALFAGSHYRTFDNDPHASPYADIQQLPAAHILCARADASVHIARYWELLDQGDSDESEAVLAEQYRELLKKTVLGRVAAAGKPAFTLSGGMDSSSVLATTVSCTGAKQDAYSSVYTDPTFDETAEIRSMLDDHVQRWHPVVIGTPDVFDLVERMVRVHDEPVATATWLSHFLVCEQAAKEGFSALFGGLGGDELNAGEYEYFFYHFADLKRAGEEVAFQSEAKAWARHHDHPIYRKSPAIAERQLARLVDLGRPGLCLPDRARIERYVAALAPGFFDLKAYVPVMDTPFRSYLKNRTYQDLFRETAPCCLRAEDRQCAAFGLEHFDPFLDHRLLELMFRVPGRLKIRDGVTKILLRRAMQGILPEETRARIKKTGWNAPAHVWFSGANAARLRDMVASRAFRERGVYEVMEVERLIDEHEAIIASGDARENHMMFFWQLANLESWLAAYRLEIAA